MTIKGLDTPAIVHKGGMTLTGTDEKMVGHCLLQFLWSLRLYLQCAKKVVSDSPGLVDFTIGQVNPVLNLKGK